MFRKLKVDLFPFHSFSLNHDHSIQNGQLNTATTGFPQLYETSNSFCLPTLASTPQFTASNGDKVIYHSQIVKWEKFKKTHSNLDNPHKAIFFIS